jgi:hypothetical protein
MDKEARKAFERQELAAQKERDREVEASGLESAGPSIRPEGLLRVDGAVETADEWTAEQLAMFPDLALESLTDEQLGLDLDVPEQQDRDLFPREMVFVREYCCNGMRGTAAARKAGYAYPHVAASRMLKRPIIQAAIARELKQLLEDGKTSREALVLKLSAIAHGDLGELARNLTHPDRITLEDLAALPPEITATIKKIKSRTHETITKHGEELETFVDLELHDPRSAIELLAKILRYTTDQVDLTSGGKPLAGGAAVIYMPAETGRPVDAVVATVDGSDQSDISDASDAGVPSGDACHVE